jgi:hypothetical protein
MAGDCLPVTVRMTVPADLLYSCLRMTVPRQYSMGNADDFSGTLFVVIATTAVVACETGVWKEGMPW